MARLTGLILMLLGLALIVLKLAFKSIIEKIPVIANLQVLWIIVIGLALIIVGFLLSRGRKGGVMGVGEVPIYRGDKIIGYRRR